MRESVAAVLAALQPGALVPCRITSTSPLQVSISGTSAVPGEKVAGLSYSTAATNNAYALIKPGKPLILPIG